MNVALQRPWTVERFLDWAERQDARYEFDGVRPVAMTGGNANHTRVTMNIHAALRSRLRGSPCSAFGPDLGVATVRNAIRYPDALVTCTKFPGTDCLAPDVKIVFEVLSPTSGRMDRIIKPREYAAVSSMRRYVIAETKSAGLLVLHRKDTGDDWRAMTLTGADTLELPEIGIAVPVGELYEDLEFGDDSV